jgi:hypothetical protein
VDLFGKSEVNRRLDKYQLRHALVDPALPPMDDLWIDCVHSRN